MAGGDVAGRCFIADRRVVQIRDADADAADLQAETPIRGLFDPRADPVGQFLQIRGRSRRADADANGDLARSHAGA